MVTARWPLAVVVLGALITAGCGSAAPTCSSAQSTTSRASTVGATGSPAVAALARRYEPTVRLTALDRFWPVSVADVLRERGVSGNGVVLLGTNTVPVGAPTPADLKPSDNESANLTYPAVLTSKAAQMDAFLRGLGMSAAAIKAWPAGIAPEEHKTAEIYFFDAGTGCAYPGADTIHDVALQYWFFYPFNYYPLTVDTAKMLTDPLQADDVDSDFHEGDWEHITVLVHEQGKRTSPQYVWMARHATEGKLLAWNQVEHDGSGHPVVYPAFGGHPSYPDCGAHARTLTADALYDYVVCGAGLVTLSAAATPLIDLSKMSWSCWPGYFGTTQGTSKSGGAGDPTDQFLAVPPISPLRQAENAGDCHDATQGGT